MNIYELNGDQLQELKEAYFYQLIEIDDYETLDEIDCPSQIPDDIIFHHYYGIDFVNDDFISTMNKDNSFAAMDKDDEEKT